MQALLRSIFSLITLLAIAVCIPSGMAATVTWIGQGDTDNWSDVYNWENATAPQDGDTLAFETSQYKANNNDIVSLGAYSLSFSTTGYTLEGNGITLTNTGTIISGSPAIINIDSITLTGADGLRLITGSKTISSKITQTEGSKIGIQFYSGTLTLSNDDSDFTGDVILATSSSVSSGTIEFTSIANAGEASALGAGSTINIQGNSSNSDRKLSYIGTSNAATNRNITITNPRTSNPFVFSNDSTNNSNLELNGSIKITYAGAYSGSTLYFTGTSTDTSTLNGALTQK